MYYRIGLPNGGHVIADGTIAVVQDGCLIVGYQVFSSHNKSGILFNVTDTTLVLAPGEWAGCRRCDKEGVSIILADVHKKNKKSTDASG